MKYAIKFYQNCRVLPQADEIILKYEEVHENLIDYIDNYSDEQRIVIDICGYDKENILKDNLSIWKAVSKKHENFAIKLNEYHIDIISKLQENNIKFFLDTRVDTIDKLCAVVFLGVSDVYICNELGFSLKSIAKFCHNRGVKIRVYPNIAQSSSNNEEINSFTKFYIRPNDVKVYEDYVDIFEFFTDVSSMDRQSVLFNIYKDEEWLGKLSDIILGIKEDIINESIFPAFAEARTDCNKKCIYEKCKLCDRILDFTKIVNTIKEESGQVLIVRRKDEHKSSINERTDEE